MKNVRIVIVLLIVTLAFIATGWWSQAEAANRVKVYKDGQAVTFTKGPFYSNEQLYVEFDTVYKKLGYTIATKKKNITYTKKGFKNKMTIGSKNVFVNGKKKVLAAPVQKIKEKIYVPVTAVPLTTEKTIRWNKKKTSLYIEIKNPSIKIANNITSLSLEKGSTKRFAVSSPHTVLKNEDILWESSDTNVAKVDGKGLISGIKKGTAIITISIPDSSSTYQVKVNVTPKKVKTISLVKSKELFKGEKQTLKYSVTLKMQKSIK